MVLFSELNPAVTSAGDMIVEWHVPCRKQSVYRMFWTILVGEGRDGVFVEVDFSLESISNVFVGVNCLVLMHWWGLQGPDLRKLQAWTPGSLRDATPGVRTVTHQKCRFRVEMFG